MFSRFKEFMSRHKRKFMVTGIIIGGTVIGVRYAQRKLREYQELQARQFIERTKRTQHFESNERTCNQAIIGLAPQLCETICKQIDTDTLLKQLKENPENKNELWNELTILTFTKLTTLVYACTMFIIVLRIQINILGGYLYKDILNGRNEITTNIQSIYLSFGHYLIYDGIEKLTKFIEPKIRDVLGKYDLKTKLRLSDTEQLFWSIQMAINSDPDDPITNLAKYVFPIDPPTESEPEILKLYSETLDMLESDEISTLCINNVSRGFSIIMDNIADFYSESKLKENGKISESSTSSSATAVPSTSKADLNSLSTPTSTPTNIVTINNINTIEVPLAKLIPIVNCLASKRFNYNGRPPSLSTSLITLYLISEKLKILGANVYEVFST